jgi:3-methylornithyl-N6-L-lysine dehydrogenase
MTRLKTDDINNVALSLRQFDETLVSLTTKTLMGVACHALGLEEIEIMPVTESVKIGVVPVKSGEGIIGGFCDTVKHIVEHIGFDGFVTQGTDVAGMAEAVERNADVIMMADDYRFIALNIQSGRIVDNSEATARGMVAGLDLMAGGLEGKSVLILGCGPVGCNSAIAALQFGAEVGVYDVMSQCSLFLEEQVKRRLDRGIVIEKKLAQALRYYHLMVDATDSENIINADVIKPETYIAAPGMPLGITPAAVKKLSGRLYHDPLQTGVAVMALDAIKGEKGYGRNIK